jgi:hypothetical protein
MTLKELFAYIDQNSNFILFYFLIIPVTALLCGILGKGKAPSVRGNTYTLS